MIKNEEETKLKEEKFVVMSFSGVLIVLIFYSSLCGAMLILLGIPINLFYAFMLPVYLSAIFAPYGEVVSLNKAAFFWPFIKGPYEEE